MESFNNYDKRSAKTGGLVGLNRLKGCLPVDLHLGGVPQVSEVHLEQLTVRISMPPVWAVQCPHGLYQAIEASISKTTPPRDMTNYVFRRHVGEGTDKIGTTEQPSVYHNVPGVSGLCDQLRQVRADTIPKNPVLGLYDQLQGDKDNVDRSERGTDCGNMQGCTTEAGLVTARTGQSDRQDDCLPAGHLPGPVIVQKTTAPEKSNLATISLVQSFDQVESGGSVETGMVVHKN